MSFGEFLKERRKALGLSQNDIAQSLNYTPQVISKWEKGLSNPPLDISCDLASLLKISLSDYFKMDATSPICKGVYPTFDASSFCSHLKIYRTHLSLTQKQVSDKTGINPQSIQRFENGKSLPDVEEFIKLCESYKLEPLFVFESKDLNKLEIAKEITAKTPRNKLLIPFCAVSTIAVALAALSSVLSWKLFTSDKQTVLDTTSSSAQETDINFTLPGYPIGDIKPVDLSLNVSEVLIEGHNEYEISLSFQNIERFMYCGYKCTIKYLEDETWTREILLESALDEYVTMTTCLADYARSGTYYIYSLVGLHQTIQNGMNVKQEENIDLTSIDRYFILENENQDNTAPTINSMKLEVVDSIVEEGCYDVAFHVDVEDDNSGIRYIGITGRLLEAPYTPQWFDIEETTTERYGDNKLDIYIRNYFRIKPIYLEGELETLRNTDEFDRFMIVVSDKEGNVTTVLQTFEETLAF